MSKESEFVGKGVERFIRALDQATATNDMRQRRAWLHAARDAISELDPVYSPLEAYEMVAEESINGPTKSRRSGLGNWSVTYPTYDGGDLVDQYRDGVIVETAPSLRTDIFVGELGGYAFSIFVQEENSDGYIEEVTATLEDGSVITIPNTLPRPLEASSIVE